jgi:8-oxo-dGTP diphosphatase
VSRESSEVIVVAGVIEKNGLILIGQRKKGSRHAMKWEFPGGKLETGETPRGALKRELAEELCIDASIGREIVRYEYSYSRGKAILLIFFKVLCYEGTPINMVFHQIRWEDRDKLLDYDFLDGDIDFIRRLTGGEFHSI